MTAIDSTQNLPFRNPPMSSHARQPGSIPNPAGQLWPFSPWKAKFAKRPQLGRQAIRLNTQKVTASLGDFNDDLQRLGRDEMRAAVRVQLAPEGETARGRDRRAVRPSRDWA